MDLPEGEVRSDACSPPEPKGEGFQIVVDVTVRSYPALWVKLFGVGEHVGVACNAPATGGDPSFATIFILDATYQWFPNTVAPAGMQ